MAETRPTTPEAWMAYLARKLDRETDKSDVFVRYYDGQDSKLSYAQEKFREVFGNLFWGWQDNFSRLIVDSISERLNIKGFRFGTEEEADEEAMAIWNRSFLAADSNAAHIDSLIRGHSYLIVWEDKEGNPIIQPEPASQVAVQYEAGSRRTIEAAIKRYFDDWGQEHCTLWTADYIYTADRGDDGGDWKLHEKINENPLGVVPVVTLSNRSRLITNGRLIREGDADFVSFSELAPILRLQDAINKISADAIVASEFAAFPQRVITGLESFDDMDAENEAMLKAYVDRILTFDGEDVKFGTFESADLGNYVKLIDMLVQHMASQSRVPFHYFLLNGGQAPSGDAVTAAEAGLVAKSKERMLHFGEAWTQAMRMAFLLAGDTERAADFSAQVIWQDPEHRSYGALTDALLKQKDLGVPMVVLQKKLGYTNTETKQFPALLEKELEWDLKKAKAMAPITGAQGGSASAGNGTKANQPTKNVSTERQKSKANAA